MGKIYHIPVSVFHNPLMKNFVFALAKRPLAPARAFSLNCSLTGNRYLHLEHLRFSPTPTNLDAHRSQCERRAAATRRSYLKDGFVSIQLFDDNSGYYAQFLFSLNPVPLMHHLSSVNI